MTDTSKTIVLFLCNRLNEKSDVYSSSYGGKGSGLKNSSKFAAAMLCSLGIQAISIEMTDMSEAYAAMDKYNPDIVIVEAIFITPDLMQQFRSNYPMAKIVVRIHSEIAFLSQEGQAISWLRQYLRITNVFIASNSKRAQSDLQNILYRKVIYLPNYYPVRPQFKMDSVLSYNGRLNIGMFGAIRLLKNNLSQCVAAIVFANQLGLKLVMNMNANTAGDLYSPYIERNINELFEGTKHKVIYHDWADHDKFLELVSMMQLIMQVSFSETFNVVAADAVRCGVPIVGSTELSWLPPQCMASPTNINSMVIALKNNYVNGNQKRNYDALATFNKESMKTWKHSLDMLYL